MKGEVVPRSDVLVQGVCNLKCLEDKFLATRID